MTRLPPRVPRFWLAIEPVQEAACASNGRLERTAGWWRRSVKVVAAIARVPRDEHNRPLTPGVIRSVRLEGGDASK